MTVAELLPWVCLATCGLGLLAFVTSWIVGGTDDDSNYVLFVLMILGGAIGFVLLR